MRDFLGINRKDMILFLVCCVVFVAIWFVWTVVPFGIGSIADGDSLFTGLPLIGDLPQQSVSKLVITAALYLMSIIYALLAVASSEYRKGLIDMVILGVLTFLGWVTLNYWVTSGFLNSPSVLLYGVATLVFLVAWFVILMRSIIKQHDATALFLVSLGLGLTLFVTITQLVALLTPNWRTPTQGVPVLYTMTLNALVGLFIAGVGGNMLWRDRRTQVLAAGAKKR